MPKYIKAAGITFPYVEPPQPDTPDEREDLNRVISQFTDRAVPPSLQDMADDVLELFVTYMGSKGIEISEEDIKPVVELVRPIIDMLKDHFGRDRPTPCAQRLGVDFEADIIKSAGSKSYPSGHTIESHVLADYLARQFPEHRDELDKVADIVAQSRIDRGVHFPSDIEYGKKIADVICKKMKLV